MESRFREQHSTGDRHLCFSPAFPQILQARTVSPSFLTFSLCHSVSFNLAVFVSQARTRVRWKRVSARRSEMERFDAAARGVWGRGDASSI